MIDDKFNRLISYFHEISEGIINKTIALPIIKSKWIYKRDKNDKFDNEATFCKDINIKDQPDSAKLQLIADTYAELLINDSLVTKVYAKRCLSLLVDYKRIKYIDIKPFLKQNQVNTIEVRVKNFNSKDKNAAGFNLIAEIYNNDKTKTMIMSDETWLCNNGEKKWKKAYIKKYPSIVIEPNFKTNRPSWIER
jgi:hypothetical protein